MQTTEIAKTDVLTGIVTAHQVTSLGTIADEWISNRKSSHTKTAYRRDFRHYVAWCNDRDLDPMTIRRRQVNEYSDELTAAGLSPATVSRRLSALSSFYRYAVSEDYLERNPALKANSPTVSTDDSATVGLTREDGRRLLAAAAAHSPRTGALISLLLDNGLRISEALGADASDLGTLRGHRTLTITRKGNHQATVPLAPLTLAALDAYLGGRTTGPLFQTRTGRRVDEPAAFRLVRKLAKAAGVENADRMSPHSLRHGAITAALDAGVSLRDVQDFAGHADPRTTRRYDRARYSLDRNATYAVAAYFAGADA